MFGRIQSHVILLSHFLSIRTCRVSKKLTQFSRTSEILLIAGMAISGLNNNRLFMSLTPVSIQSSVVKVEQIPWKHCNCLTHYLLSLCLLVSLSDFKSLS